MSDSSPCYRFGIPTEWEGILFRSKLEMYVARELVTLDIRFVYEPEAFTDGKTNYLPDFYLPQQDLLMEVKPVTFLHEVEPRRKLIERIDKQFVVVDYNHQDKLVPLLLYGYPETCDPEILSCEGNKDRKLWSDQCQSGTFGIELTKRKFPCPFFTMGHSCALRSKYGDDCTCTR